MSPFSLFHNPNLESYPTHQFTNSIPWIPLPICQLKDHLPIDIEIVKRVDNNVFISKNLYVDYYKNYPFLYS